MGSGIPKVPYMLNLSPRRLPASTGTADASPCRVVCRTAKNVTTSTAARILQSHPTGGSVLHEDPALDVVKQGITAGYHRRPSWSW